MSGRTHHASSVAIASALLAAVLVVVGCAEPSFRATALLSVRDGVAWSLCPFECALPSRHFASKHATERSA